MKTWVARKIAQHHPAPDRDAAGQVDRVIAPYADRKTAGELVAFAEAEAIRADPDLARRTRRGSQDQPGCGSGPADTGTKTCSSVPTQPT